jgi:hypothetical protein
VPSLPVPGEPEVLELPDPSEPPEYGLAGLTGLAAPELEVLDGYGLPEYTGPEPPPDPEAPELPDEPKTRLTDLFSTSFPRLLDVNVDASLLIAGQSWLNSSRSQNIFLFS